MNNLLTVQALHAMKKSGEKIACLTAYDASFSALLDTAGIDVILVGDTLGMIIQGHSTTVPVTLDSMVYHTHCVTRTRKRAFVIADLPFMTYSDPRSAAINAARLLREAGAQMVKLEGAHVEIIRFMVAQGIPVCGHLGLLPQSIHLVGEYKVHGKSAAAAEQLIEQAHDLQRAGIGLLVLECVPAALAKTIAQALSIPVIGIGAGVDCDGQVLVLHDMLGLAQGKAPRFVKNFMHGASSIPEAVLAYQTAVKQAKFPSSEHSYI